MRIIGKDGKEYTNVKECLQADAAFEKAEKEKALAAEKATEALRQKIADEKAQVSKRKKELSDKIEEANDKLDYFTKEYDAVRKDAAEIINKAKEEATKIINEAAKKVEEASAERAQAISAFNAEFGPYKTVLTGSKALEEYNRFWNNFKFNSIFDTFWPFK